MSRIGTFFRNIRAALLPRPKRMPKIDVFPQQDKDLPYDQQGCVARVRHKSISPAKPKRLWWLGMVIGILIGLAILLWVFWPKAIPPTPDPKVKSGWEEVILARVQRYTTRRLDSLLMGDIEVEALFDSIIRRETKIYWQVTEEEDWKGPSSLGAPAFAYNQLAAVHGYGKRADATDLHVAILDFRLGPRRHELESLTLQLEIQ